MRDIADESKAPSASFLPDEMFMGIGNPRYLRVLKALTARSVSREEIDVIAGVSNGPDIIAELRHLGFEIPCHRITALDRDGKLCRPGIYHLTQADRARLYPMHEQKGSASC